MGSVPPSAMSSFFQTYLKMGAFMPLRCTQRSISRQRSLQALRQYRLLSCMLRGLSLRWRGARLLGFVKKNNNKKIWSIHPCIKAFAELTEIWHHCNHSIQDSRYFIVLLSKRIEIILYKLYEYQYIICIIWNIHRSKF